MLTLVNRASIRIKIITAFGVLLALTAGSGLFAVQKMTGMHRATQVVTTNYLPSVVAVGELGGLVQKFRITESSHILSTDPAQMQSIEKDMNRISAAYELAHKNYEPLLDVGEETERFKHIDELWLDYLQMHDILIATSRKNENEDAAALFKGKMSAIFIALDDLLTKDVGYNKSHGIVASDEERAVYQTTLTSTYMAIDIAGLVTMIFGFGLVQNISKPLTRMTAAMTRLAGRDRSVEIPGSTRADEIGAMAAAVQVFKDNMIRGDQLAADQEVLKAAAAASLPPRG